MGNHTAIQKKAEAYSLKRMIKKGETFRKQHETDFIAGYKESVKDSRSPEMLDFLKRLSGEMLRNDFVLNEAWYDQAQQLIKSATQI